MARECPHCFSDRLRLTVGMVFRPSLEGPRGSAGPGPSHRAAPRLRWRGGAVEPATGVLPCAALWWETGRGRLRARSRGLEKRVRGLVIPYLRSWISIRRESGARYCRGAGRRRRWRAAPPPDDLKIDSTRANGTAHRQTVRLWAVMGRGPCHLPPIGSPTVSIIGRGLDSETLLNLIYVTLSHRV